MNGFAASLALRFALELAALVSLAYWGLGAEDGAAGWALAIATPAAFAVAWGVLVSPRVRVRLAPAARLSAVASGVVNHLAGRPSRYRSSSVS